MRVTSALCSCLPIMLTQRLSWVMWSPSLSSRAFADRLQHRIREAKCISAGEYELQRNEAGHGLISLGVAMLANWGSSPSDILEVELLAPAPRFGVFVKVTFSSPG